MGGVGTLCAIAHYRAALFLFRAQLVFCNIWSKKHYKVKIEAKHLAREAIVANHVLTAIPGSGNGHEDPGNGKKSGVI